MISAFTAAASSWLATRWKSLRPTRESLVVLALLAVIFEATYLGAFFVRGELLLKPSDSRAIVNTILFVVALKICVFYTRGLCHRPWRAARFADLNKLLRAATVALLLLVACNYFGGFVPGHVPIPRSVLLLDWAFTLLGVGGMQAVARSVYEELMPATAMGNERAVLVVDASPAGRELALDLSRIAGGKFFVAGLLDDDPAHYGEQVGRARVLGPVSMAPACAERLRAAEVIIREGALFGTRLRALHDACAAIGVRVCIAEQAPPEGAGNAWATGHRIRVRGVGLRDLLSRAQAHLDDHDVHVLPFLRGKTVLVTGAGGSIGSEICRQALRFKPDRMVMLDRAEPALFAIHRELSSRDGGASLQPVICDVTNPDRLDRVLAEHKPQIVIHAAAFKHLPLMESHPVEAIENNALATAALAELCDAHGVEAFIALSTDKAVHPSSVMGASKLVAERFLQSFGAGSSTRFVAVRFGNVLGSSGSAVPIFEEQLSRGLPITITHPDVRRYFMTIDEAAQLVLLAGALPGRGATYVLEMGEPLRIVDVVQSLAFVMNVPAERVAIRYCGLRPGEKLDEELFFEDERREATPNALVVRVERPARPIAEVRGWLDDLKDAIAVDADTAARVLMRIVTGDCSGQRPLPDDGSRLRSVDRPPLVEPPA